MANSQQAQNLIYLMGVNDRVIHRQLDGLTNDDLLLQPAMFGNCANWVLGHIVQSLNNMLKRNDLEVVMTEAEEALYQPNSEPITGADSPHLSMETLLDYFETAQERVIAHLETLTDDDFAKEIREGVTAGKPLSFAVWHMGYHVGQFEYLRQLTGVADKVI